jgi:dienelactone hydrolase
LLRNLAAQGFVVAAPDFPLSSTSPPGPVTQDDIDNQARDVSFLVASFSGDGAALPAAVRGHVAPTEAGVVGHSDGGATAARVATNSCCFDGRIGAAVILSGDEGQSGGAWAVAGSAPMLLLQGTADTINPWSLSQRLYDDAAAPKWLVAINGADHLTPYTSGPQRGAIVALVAEFLRARLLDPSRLSGAQDAANRDGLSLVASA